MNSTSTAKLLTLTNAQAYIVLHPEFATDIENFGDESTNLDGIIVNVGAADKLKETIPDINAKDVMAYKQAMSDTTFDLVKLARSICTQTKNQEVLNALDYKANYIMSGDKQICLSRATEIQVYIVKNKALFTNIKPALFTAASLATSTYQTMKDVPETTIHNKKDFGTGMIKSGIKDGRESVKNMLQMLEVMYGVNSTLVTAFRTILHVTVLGVRYTPTNIKMIDAVSGNAIVGGILSRTSKKGKITTFIATPKGVVPFKTHRAGKSSYVAKCSGYPDTPLDIVVKRGVTNNFTVSMTKNL